MNDPTLAPSPTRRALLRLFAWLGLAGLLAPLPSSRPARAQGMLANLGPEEPVDATMKRLFAARPIKDGGATILISLL